MFNGVANNSQKPGLSSNHAFSLFSTRLSNRLTTRVKNSSFSFTGETRMVKRPKTIPPHVSVGYLSPLLDVSKPICARARRKAPRRGF